MHHPDKRETADRCADESSVTRPPVSKLLAFQHHQNKELMGLCRESLLGPGLSMYVAKSFRNCSQGAHHMREPSKPAPSGKAEKTV